MNPNCSRKRKRGFTLIEIMVVVAILGIIAAIGIPAIGNMRKQESLTGGVRSVMEVCQYARSQAILQDSVSEIVIHPRDKMFEVRILGGVPAANTTGGSDDVHLVSRPARRIDTGGLASSAKLPESVNIELIGVNFQDFTEDDEVRVQFYPNGTCDEFKLVLRGDKGDFRTINLEVVTGLASVDWGVGVR